MNLTKIIIFFYLLFLMSNVIAKNPPLLVMDMHDDLALPGHFRSSEMMLPTTIDSTGFAQLHILGSRQFSQKSLTKILQHLSIKKLLIVDLRQESHGFLNGSAVSWYGRQDAANAGKSAAEIEETQANLLHDLSKLKVVTVHEILQKSEDGQIEQVQPVQLAVQNVVSERDWATDHDCQYERIYVQDFHPPDLLQVDRFIELVKQASPEAWIYFHCRGGSGRSTTFMAMYDMMKNAKQVKIDDILARQAVIGGKDLRHLPDPTIYKYKLATKRLAFIEKFYQYCHSNKDNYGTTWSEWLKTNKNG